MDNSNQQRNLFISTRECEVLKLVASEKTSKEIAQELQISTETVQTHRQNIMNKMGVKNAAGLIRCAFEKGFLNVLLVLLILTSTVSLKGQLSYIINDDPNHNGEVYTGDNIDLRSIISFTCGDSLVVSYNYSSGISANPYTVLQNNSENFYSVNSISSSESILISNTGYLQAVIDDSDGLPYSTDIWTRFQLQGGSLCIDQTQILQQSVEVFQDGELCETYSDIIEIQPKWKEEQYKINVDLLTNESDLCYGGIAKYRVRVHHAQTVGGLDLSNPILKFHTLNSTPLAVLLTNGAILNHDATEFINCGPSYQVDLPFLSANNSFTDILIMLNLFCDDCNVFSDPGLFNVYIEGADPCLELYTNSQILSNPEQLNSFTKECCGSGTSTVPFFSKSGNPTDPDRTQFSPNACYSTQYEVIFDNTLSGNQYADFKIQDDLPSNFDLDRIRFQGNFGSLASPGISYQNTFLLQPFSSIDLIIDRIDGSSHTMPDITSSVGNLSNPDNPITRLTFVFNGEIRPWIEFIGIRFTGKLTSAALPGSVLVNSATAFEGNSGVAGPVTRELTVKSDNPYINRRTYILDNNGYVLNSPSLENGDKFTVLYRVQNSGGASLSVNDQFSSSLPLGFEYCSPPTFYLGSNASNIFPTGDFSMVSPLNGNYSISSDSRQLDYQNFDDLESYCQNGEFLYLRIDVVISESATGGVKSFNYSMPELSTSELGTSSSASLNVISQYITSPSIWASCSSSCDISNQSTMFMSPGESGYLYMVLNNASNHSLSNVSYKFSHTQTGDNTSDCETPRNSQFGIDYGSPVLCNDPVATVEIGNISVISPCGPATELSLDGSLSPFTDMIVKVPITISADAEYGQVAFADFSYSLSTQGLMDQVLSQSAKIEIVPNSCGEPITPANVACDLINVSYESVNSEVGECCNSITIQQPYNSLITGINISTQDGENIEYWAIAGQYNMGLSNALNDTLRIEPPSGESHISIDEIQVVICINEFYSFPQNLKVTFEMSDGDELIQTCAKEIEYSCSPESIGSSFTKYYGDSSNNYIFHIEPIGNFVYLSGLTEREGESELFSTFSKFDFYGNLIWERQIFDFPSSIIDFEEKDGDEIVIVGRTSPSGININNKSFIATLSKSDGSVAQSSIYDNSGREFYRSIVNNTSNPTAPFYILAQKNTFNGGIADDVFIINLDNEFNVLWSKKIDYSSDDQMSNWMSRNLNGDLILAGSDGATGDGMIVIVDKDDGAILNAVSTGPFHFHYSVADNGFGYVVSSQDRISQTAFISFFNYELELINSIKLEDQDILIDISFASNGDFYGIGRKIDSGGSSGGGPASIVTPTKGSNSKSASTYPVINRFKFNFPQNGSSGSIYLYESKRFSVSDSDYGGLDLFASTKYGQLFHASSRKRTFYPVDGPSYSHWDAFIASFDLSLNENCLLDYEPVTLDYTYAFTNVTPIMEDYTLPTSVSTLVSDTLNYSCENPCLPDCQADFSFSIDQRISCTGQRLIFDNLSTDNLGDYIWLFGDGTTSTESDPSHFFEGPGTFRVCLSALECTNQICKYIDIEITNQNLLVGCTIPASVAISTIQGECFANYSVPNPIFGNNFCIQSAFSRSDGLAISDPYQIGTTSTTWSVFNRLGDTAYCNFDVIVIDNESPTIVCPSDIEIEIQEDCSLINLPLPQVNENCEYTISYNYPSDYCFTLGTTEVTIRVDDGANEPVYCSFNIILSSTDTVASSDVCEESIVDNGDLSTLPPGNNFYQLNSWSAIHKFSSTSALSSPQVNGNDGCQEAGCFQMWGNQVVGEGIYQRIDINPGYSYNFSFCARDFDFGFGSPQVRIRAVKESTTIFQKPPTFGQCNAPECQEVLLSDILQSYWETYEVRDWIPEEEYDYIVITVGGPSDIDGPDFLSWARIDDICITEELLPCPEDLIINTVMSGPETYKSYDEIQTDSRVALNSYIRLTASTSTILRENFEVAEGGVLEIDNEGCEEDCTYLCLSTLTIPLMASTGRVTINASDLITVDAGCNFSARFDREAFPSELIFSCSNQGVNNVEIAIFNGDQFIENCMVELVIVDEYGVCGF